MNSELHIPPELRGTRLIDCEGVQAAAGWIDSASTGSPDFQDNPGVGILGSTNGVKFIQRSAAATYLVRKILFNSDGWDCSKSDIWTMETLWEMIPSRWRVGSNGAIEIAISSDNVAGTFTNYKLYTLLNGTETGLVVLGKNTFSWTNADWTGTGGTIDYSHIRNIRIRFNTASAADEFTLLGFWNGRKAIPHVAITFDDGYADFVSAAATANASGIPFTAYVIPDLIGNTPTYMSEAEVATIAANPLNLIGGHNAELIWSEPDSGFQAVGETIAWLNARGYASDHYAYPGGGFNPNVWEIMQYYGIKCARTLRGISYSAGPPIQYASRISYECVSPQGSGMPDWLQVNASPLNNAQTLAQAKATLLKAIKKGESVVFYGHKLGGVADSTTWVTSDYNELIRYIAVLASQGLINPVNMEQFYQHFNAGMRVAA